MCRKTGLWILVVVLLLPTLSCTRLPESSAQKGVMVGSAQLPNSDSIPSQWGKLVSVTSNPAYPGWSQLWFEDETSTIRMVAFNLQTKQLGANAIVLARK
ncbi:MAG: hypothetical protein ABR899_03080 [Candidatus Krumholzibacteriaceae bacterium]|jgi:hypothetical protein